AACGADEELDLAVGGRTRGDGRDASAHGGGADVAGSEPRDHALAEDRGPGLGPGTLGGRRRRGREPACQDEKSGAATEPRRAPARITHRAAAHRSPRFAGADAPLGKRKIESSTGTFSSIFV